MNDLRALEIIKNGTRLYNKAILNNLELKQYLDNRYRDIPEDMFSYKEVLYRIEHNIEIRPLCRVCGKPVSFIGDVKNKSINVYRMTCSLQCHKVDKISFEKYSQTKKNCSTELRLIENQKREQPCLERYDERNAFIAKKDLIKNAMYERYGGFTMQSDILKEKVLNTNLEKYGYKNVFSSDLIR